MTATARRRTWRFRDVYLTAGGALLLVAGCTVQQPEAKSGRTTKDPASDKAPVSASGVSTTASDAGQNQRAAASRDEHSGAQLMPPAPFESWPKPVVALVLSGQQLGYIEPCGCSGLENQKGGLARRHTLIRQLQQERGWPVVGLDVGSQVRRYGKQPQLKFDHTARALAVMGYRAATLGAEDLRLPASELLASTNPDENESLFISANVALLAREFQPAYRIVEAGGKRIGVTAILGEQLEKRLQGDEVVHEPPLVALQRSAQELQAQDCDFCVLLAHTSLDESRQIANRVPMFDLIVAAGDTSLPSRELETIEGTKTRLMQVGTKAMYVGVVGLFDDEEEPLRYETVALDSSLADSPEMLQMLAEYQEQLKQLGLDGLGLKPQPHPRGRKFVGSEKCGECHTKAFEKWSSTPHAHATDSLVTPPNDRGSIARHFDPECLSCHVTGWEPQRFYPFESGYLALEKTPHLQHNGCENCHGPGSQHVAAESGEEDVTEDEQLRRREAMRLPLAGEVAQRKCLECHDLDNSPDFHVEGAFERYWAEVEHRGKD